MARLGRRRPNRPIITHGDMAFIQNAPPPQVHLRVSKNSRRRTRVVQTRSPGLYSAPTPLIPAIPSVVYVATPQPQVYMRRTPRPRQPQYPIILRDFGYVPQTTFSALTDSVLIGGSTTSAIHLVPHIGDTDSISGLMKPMVGVHPLIIDSVPISDSTLAFVHYFPLLNNTDLISDSAKGRVTEHKSLTDLLVISDSVVPTWRGFRSLLGVDAISDQVAVAELLRFPGSDFVAISDTVKPLVHVFRALFDVVEIDDIVSSSLTSAGGAQSVHLNDADAISNSVRSIFSRVLLLADSVNISDSVSVVRHQLFLVDSVDVSDIVKAVVTIKRHRFGKRAFMNPANIRRGVF